MQWCLAARGDSFLSKVVLTHHTEAACQRLQQMRLFLMQCFRAEDHSQDLSWLLPLMQRLFLDRTFGSATGTVLLQDIIHGIQPNLFYLMCASGIAQLGSKWLFLLSDQPGQGH